MTTHARNRSLIIDEVEHNQTDHHAQRTTDSQFATVRMTHRLHHAAITVGIHKRHDPFDNDHERERNQQSVPVQRVALP